MYYTSEKSVLILIALLKQNNIKKIVVSPGATNITFVASLQHDSFFELYSSVDERSAAYIACGLSAQSGEPVVLSCTGATASRNYYPGLTEAYYRKLPILAVTSTQDEIRIGHLKPQVIDRGNLPSDVVIKSEHVKSVISDDDEWDAQIRLNRAILELKHRGGGPVHINLATTYSRDYSVKMLPNVKAIKRFMPNDVLPELPSGKIGVFIGNHRTFTEQETRVLDQFCSTHEAVVFCDHTSGYYGEYRVQFALVLSQNDYTSKLSELDLLIHLGEVSGDTPTSHLKALNVWRVNEDGEIRDTFRKIQYVFEMNEISFFDYYSEQKCVKENSFYTMCQKELETIRSKIPELPFSNTWIASQTAHLIPKNSILHFGIFNSLRNWNFFEVDKTVIRSCNTGGFGIDGILSTLVGASFADKDKLCFVVLGDLAFFYDMNVVGNRHVGSNVRILLINNGKGTEFRNFNHPGAMFGDDADFYIAAGGHFGKQSRLLVKHYAEDLGYEYMMADTKEQYIDNLTRFVTPEITTKPMIFEVFTNSESESDALWIIRHVYSDTKGNARNAIKSIIGENSYKYVKKLLK